MKRSSLLGVFQEAIASQRKMKCVATPCGFRLIMKQMPRNADSFSSLSRMLRSERHQGRMNSDRYGETSLEQCRPNRPSVMAKMYNCRGCVESPIPVFSSNVFGPLSRFIT